MKKEMIDRLKPLRRIEYLIEKQNIENFNSFLILIAIGFYILSNVETKSSFRLFFLIATSIIIIIGFIFTSFFYNRLDKQFIDESLK